MNSVNRFVPDAAYAIRKADAAAITADTAISAGELVSPIGAPWNDEVKDGKVVVFFKASEIDSTTGDETYEVSVITSANADLSAAQTHITKSVKAGWNEILVDQEILVKDDTDAKYWGITVDVGGTTPSVKIEAYVLPPVGK
jgi:ATP-dependent protease HslVU (ClpYQ) peptidase subunit